MPRATMWHTPPLLIFVVYSDFEASRRCIESCGCHTRVKEKTTCRCRIPSCKPKGQFETSGGWNGRFARPSIVDGESINSSWKVNRRTWRWSGKNYTRFFQPSISKGPLKWVFVRIINLCHMSYWFLIFF